MLSFLLTATRRRRRLAATAFAVLTALAAPAAAHAAGTYEVQACSDGDTYGLPVADPYGGWAGVVSHVDPTHHVQNDCAGSLGLFMQLKGSDRKAPGDYAAWKFTAPSNTTVTDAVLTYDAYARPSDGRTEGSFLVTADGASGALTSQKGTGLLEARTGEYHGLAAHWLKVAAVCTSLDGSDCPSGEDANAMIHTVVVTLADDLDPDLIAASGSVLDDGAWVGPKDLAYAASDLGSGIAGFAFRVDGAPRISHVPDVYGGLCEVAAVDGDVSVFRHPKPCPESVYATESIDTTTIPDGAHQVDLVIADASGRETAIVSGIKVVANHPPVNDAAPAFGDAGAAAQPHVGSTLAASRGAWSGPNLTYALAWERCEADGSGCAQIPGATVESYIPTTADLGKRLRMSVTATNPADSVTGRTALTGPVGTFSSPPANGGDAAGGSSTGGGTSPTLPSGGGTASTGSAATEPDHVLDGHVAGEPATATCPQDRAALVLQGVPGRTVHLRHGASSHVAVLLTCAATGKPIAGARLDVATRVGTRGAVASQVTTDAAGRASLPLRAGPSRAVAVGYRMYADDPLARATTTLRVHVAARISLRASRRTLRNGQALSLSGALAGGQVPRRGVDLAVQWRDGRRWRPFAQLRTDHRGRFHYAYRFTRTRGTVRYRLRVEVLKGQVDYPFDPVASPAVRVTVRG